jgi:hypothetical protein
LKKNEKKKAKFAHSTANELNTKNEESKLRQAKFFVEISNFLRINTPNRYGLKQTDERSERANKQAGPSV